MVSRQERGTQHDAKLLFKGIQQNWASDDETAKHLMRMLDIVVVVGGGDGGGGGAPICTGREYSMKLRDGRRAGVVKSAAAT